MPASSSQDKFLTDFQRMLKMQAQSKTGSVYITMKRCEPYVKKAGKKKPSKKGSAKGHKGSKGAAGGGAAAGAEKKEDKKQQQPMDAPLTEAVCLVRARMSGGGAGKKGGKTSSRIAFRDHVRFQKQFSDVIKVHVSSNLLTRAELARQKKAREEKANAVNAEKMKAAAAAAAAGGEKKKE